jgi:hypothetical protein
VRKALAISLLALLALAPVAAAGPLDDFRRNGSIDPCRYSDQQLRNCLNGLPPDVQQYAPGLADQLSAGREGCGVGGGPGGGGDTRQLETVPGLAATGGSGGGGGAGKAKVPAPPTPKAQERQRLAGLTAPQVTTAATASDAPGWLAPLLIVAGLLAALIAFLRLRGVSPEGVTRPLKASFADAGGRTADAAAQLWDSVRMGR